MLKQFSSSFNNFLNVFVPLVRKALAKKRTFRLLKRTHYYKIPEGVCRYVRNNNWPVPNDHWASKNSFDLSISFSWVQKDTAALSKYFWIIRIQIWRHSDSWRDDRSKLKNEWPRNINRNDTFKYLARWISATVGHLKKLS